jgi:hypothetical protein
MSITRVCARAPAMTNEFREKVGKTLSYHGRQVRNSLRRILCATFHSPARRPVFVVGCSRAGTTLVYKTLSESRELGTLQSESHDFWAGLHPLQDRNWKSHVIPVSEASESCRQYVTCYFYSRTGNTRFVDKNNQNGLSVPYLYAMFPDAYFIYVKRSPGDNINSLIEGWGKAEEFATWSSVLPARVAVDNGRYNRWCFFLPEDWRDYLDASIENVCAFQYSSINQTILAAKKDIPESQWYEVAYEDLVQDPVGQFRSMFLSCGLVFDDRLALHCKDVLSRPYNAFSRIELDKWKLGRNRDRIMRVLPNVSNVAAMMGYGNGSRQRNPSHGQETNIL